MKTESPVAVTYFEKHAKITDTLVGKHQRSRAQERGQLCLFQRVGFGLAGPKRGGFLPGLRVPTYLEPFPTINKFP